MRMKQSVVTRRGERCKNLREAGRFGRSKGTKFDCHGRRLSGGERSDWKGRGKIAFTPGRREVIFEAREASQGVWIMFSDSPGRHGDLYRQKHETGPAHPRAIAS